MTHSASLTLPEADALRLGELLDDRLVGESTIDVSEPEPGRWEVVVYFEEAPRSETLLLLQTAAAEILGRRAPRWRTTALPKTDWVAKSLAGLKPVRVGRFLVHGAHDRANRTANLTSVEIEAGEAFGTGHHGSTSGCLAAIEALARAAPFRNALDLGTGSGVLAIAIAKTWHARVLASDIDPIATVVARRNARQNAAPSIRFITAAGLRHPLFAERAPFDLVVANILAGPLAALALSVARRLAPSGRVVLSGILPEQGKRVLAAYRASGLTLGRRLLRDGWLTLMLERPRSRKAKGGVMPRPSR